MDYQPYIQDIVQAVLGLAVTLVVYYISTLKKQAIVWLDAHTTANQRQTLHAVAQEAFSFAETVWAQYQGPQKMAAAIDYATQKLKGYGINVTQEEIRAAIEKAVLEYNTKAKPAPQMTVTTGSGQAPQTPNVTNS
ncbi:phage holin, LLH family [Ferviditalea candida]|uniref:Phage holin, LLH family n=1 Tax=Ferviditalea candida TaxID=3108399 RepID=A0ABU5ZKQ4_9BACL|nr:phage holin, LLH family [Paenibacillaceae bacterium T2]